MHLQTEPEAAAKAPLPSHVSHRPGLRTQVVLTIVLDALLLTCFFAIVLALANKPQASMDEDLWWHLGTGNWILQHQAVPTQNSFSSISSGTTWVAYSWLFDVFISKIYGRWQLPGVLAFTGTLLLLSASALLMLLSRYTGLRRAMVLTAPAVLSLFTMASPRPWLFTILFFIVQLYLLLKARESGRVVWLCFLLPLFALWANIHIQFIYGLIVIALFALELPFAISMKLGRPMGRLHALWFWIFLLGSGCATLANPYGWRLYTAAAQYATQSVYLAVLQEMQPLQFRSVVDWAPVLVAGLGLFAAASLKRKHPVLILLLALSCWFGFRTGRDAWLLAIAGALALAHTLRTSETATGRFTWAPWALALPLTAALGYSLLHTSNNSEIALKEAAAKRFPEKAARYIEANALPSPLYNTFDWGGYLIWRLPNMPVSIDGRTNLHGDARLARSINTWLGKSDWADDPELRKAQTILLDRECPLASILRSDRRFRLVYQDNIASVFRPSTEPLKPSTGQ